jgi:hypothetical protein
MIWLRSQLNAYLLIFLFHPCQLSFLFDFHSFLIRFLLFSLPFSFLSFFLFFSGVQGVTFGLDDVYDDKADGTYSTKKQYGRNDYQNRNRKPAAAAKTPPPNVVKVAEAKAQAKAKGKKMLGGWVDQGASRIAWDDEEEEEE